MILSCVWMCAHVAALEFKQGQKRQFKLFAEHGVGALVLLKLTTPSVFIPIGPESFPHQISLANSLTSLWFYFTVLLFLISFIERFRYYWIWCFVLLAFSEATCVHGTFFAKFCRHQRRMIIVCAIYWTANGRRCFIYNQGMSRTLCAV